jgi:nucleotide-binding universal stress UspA family protein
MRSVILTLEGAVPDRALSVVREIARRDAASVVVVHVGDDLSVVEPLVSTLREEGIDTVLETHPGSAGDAADIVADVARRRDGRLIVVATGRPPRTDAPPQPGLMRRLLGAAPCPVVAVPWIA